MIRTALVGAVLAVVVASVSYQASAANDRKIELTGVQNTRDLGGLETQDGKRVRTGQIIRSGEIDEVNDDGIATLDRMKVSAIIDLRTTIEATVSPAEWPQGQGPKRYNFPLMEREAQDIEDMRAAIKSGTAKAKDTEALFYEAFASVPRDYTSDIRKVFDVLITQPDDEAVLLHCSGGKDRTGIVSALVLSALGVSRSEIEADFLMSNVQKQANKKSVEIARQVNAASGTNMTPEAVWPSLGVRADHLAKFYDSIIAEYGSMDLYFHDGLGLTDEDLETLRARYLE